MIKTQHVSAAVLESQGPTTSKLFEFNARVLESLKPRGWQTQPRVQSLRVMVLSDMNDTLTAQPVNVHDLTTMVLYHDPVSVENRVFELQSVVLYDGYGPSLPPKVQAVAVAVLQSMVDPVLTPDPGALLNTRIY